MFKVSLMNNLTAYATFRCDDYGHECDSSCGKTTDVIHEETFSTEEEALKFYNQQKANLRFAGNAGTYVTYPVKI